MERSGDSHQRYRRAARSNGPGAARLAVTLLVAISGSFAGMMLWAPISVIAPFPLFLSLPQVFGALFAASMAYLVGGSFRSPLWRVMALSLIAAAACAVANVLLFTGMVPGIVPVDDLTPPGGMKTLSVEAFLIGTVAGAVATRGRQRQRRGWVPFCIALFLSALAILALVFVAIPLLTLEWRGGP